MLLFLALAPPPALAEVVRDGPYDDKFDWIMLTSDEWLKGDIQVMRDEKLKFESDKLDDMNIKWKDVARIHSPRVHTYILEDLTRVVGKASLVGDTLTVQTDAGPQTVPRSRLMGILAGKPSELNWWAAKVDFGLSLNAGNTQQATLNAGAKVKREDAITRAEITYSGSFGTVSGKENINRHEGSARLDVFLSRWLFLIPIASTFTYDKFLNIELRAVPAAGLGYTPVKNSILDMDLKLGAGYQYQSAISVPAGSTNPKHDAAVLFGVRAEIDIYTDVDLDLEWSTTLIPTNLGLTSHQGTAELEVEITDIVDIGASFIFSRLEQPSQKEDGTVPEKNDYQLVLSVGLDFGYN